MTCIYDLLCEGGLIGPLVSIEMRSLKDVACSEKDCVGAV